MDIEEIKRLAEKGKIQWRSHILKRMSQRGIKIQEVIGAVEKAKIIEEYLNDFPFPSCLILGYYHEKPFHIVCSVGQEYLWMITVYHPTEKYWMPDFETRRVSG